MSNEIPALLVAGPLRMEYFLLPDGKTHLRIPGGPALYAAAGARLWSREPVGLVSRVGRNFSADLLHAIQAHGIDTSGVRILPDHAPSLGFYYFETWEKQIDWEPVKFFAKFGLACPEDLLEYTPPALTENASQPFPEIAVHSEDLTPNHLQARAAYITPCHYQSQVTLAVALRRQGIGTLLLSPPEGLMLPAFRSQLRELLHGIDILFAREESLRAFIGDSDADAAALSEYISRWGPKIILLQRELQGIHLYDSDSRISHFLPFYPVEMMNPVSIGDAFCGGFLATWRTTYNPVESALAGCISASLSMEGIGGLFALDRNPGLSTARLDSLRRSYRP
jgi:sugar/nucleoside kinase (ribokinase family)